VADYRAAIKLDPKHAEAHASLAWALASYPRDELRDGKSAVKYALRACELTGEKDTNALSALAAAYAECGDFKRAIEWQRKALTLGYPGEPEREERAKKRIKLYEAGKPYREE